MIRQVFTAFWIFVSALLVVAQNTPKVPFNDWHIARLRPSISIQRNFFGVSAAASGKTAVISADDAAYVYVEPASGWKNASENAKLTPTGQVAIDGNTIVTCCGPDLSAAYVFVKPTGGWTTTTQTATLTLPQRGDGFESVAVSGDVVVVGNAGALVNGNAGQGAVYIYVKPAGGWAGTISPVATLVASDGVAYDGLGASVAIDHDTIVAGAPTSGVQFNGSVYVFVKPENGWTNGTQTAKLTASIQHAALGSATSISGNVILEGAAYAGYIYVEPSGGWTDMTESAQLSDAAMEFSANSISISGPVVVMGNPLTSNGQTAGDVYFFERPEGGWQTSTVPNLVLAGGTPSTLALGWSVAASGSTFVSGAPYVNNNSGVAYVAGRKVQ